MSKVICVWKTNRSFTPHKFLWLGKESYWVSPTQLGMVNEGSAVCAMNTHFDGWTAFLEEMQKLCCSCHHLRIFKTTLRAIINCFYNRSFGTFLRKLEMVLFQQYITLYLAVLASIYWFVRHSISELDLAYANKSFFDGYAQKRTSFWFFKQWDAAKVLLVPKIERQYVAFFGKGSLYDLCKIRSCVKPYASIKIYDL